MLNKAVIDLKILRKNALAVKGKLNVGVKFCAVVKADGYGHGGTVIANALYNVVDCFAVALVEEGVELRLSGIDKDILVLIPCFDTDLERAIGYNLTLTVCSVEQVDKIEKQARRQGVNVKVHVKVNTGMNRQGVDGSTALEEILERIARSKHIMLDGAYSHFANPENKMSRIRAENAFLVANNLVKRYNNKAVCHISASGGFLAGVQADMVRVGILLYGYKPFKSDNVCVKPIMKIYSPIIGERFIEKGESALYGDCKSQKAQKISLVRYGYADGLFREKTLGQFNNRCMDVTALTSPVIKNGNALIFDDADKLAKKYGTISYELLTKATMRAEKIYIR